MKKGRWVRHEDVVVKYDTARYIENEIRALHFLSNPGHPNICPLLHSFTCVDDPTRLYMVIPYYPGGDLIDIINLHINNKTWLTEQELADIFLPVFSALEYCHKLGVAYLDISPEQIWFDSRGVPVLGDFDAVGLTHKPGLISLRRGHGKASFMSPQMVQLQPLDPFAHDIFSLGCTIFTAAAKCFFLEQVDVCDVRKLKGRPRYKILTMDPDEGSARLVSQAKSTNMSPLLKDMITRMTRCNPQQRPTIGSTMIHRWTLKQVQEQESCSGCTVQS